MMKRVIILWIPIVLLCLNGVSQSLVQLPEEYVVYASRGGYTWNCELVVTHSDSCALYITVDALPDVLITRTLLNGHIVQQGDKLLFKDKIFGHTMQAVIESDSTLVFTTAFAPVKDDTFRKQSVYPSPLVNELNPDSFTLAVDPKACRIQYVKDHSSPYPLTTGKYMTWVPSSNGLDDYLDSQYLKVQDNKKYELWYYETLISRGQWSRQNNLLKLHDQDLDADFWMLIGPDNTLTSMLLPGDYPIRDEKQPYTPFVLRKVTGS